MLCPRTVTLRGDAAARGMRVMVAVIGADIVSQRRSAGELCTRVGELASGLGTSTAGGNMTTCGGCRFRSVGTDTGSALCEGQVIEHAADECPDLPACGRCCRLGPDGSLFAEQPEEASSLASPELGDPFGGMPAETAGDMVPEVVPEVGCLRCRNFVQ